MNKPLTAITLAGSLLLPLGAMADETEDLTIRVMEMNENSVEAVTRNIELPEAASEQAVENAASGLQTANQNRVRNRIMIEEGGDQLMLQEQERLREQMEEREQERAEMRENAREQFEQRDQLQDEIIGPGGPGGPLSPSF